MPASPVATKAVRLMTAALWTLAAAVGLAGEAERARRILSAAGVRGGLVVHLGCGDGRLTAALRASDRYLVHGLDADAADVAEARGQLQKLGLYGEISVARFDGRHLPYADNLVNLIVAEDRGDVPMEELTRVLAPLGVAYLKQGDAWAKTVKPWPKNIDEWTHWLHGPDGNAVARDKVAGPPRGMQWIARPLWSRHHNTVPSVTAWVSARGRVFAVVDEAPPGMHGDAPDQWALVARDAFNGILLWRIPLPEWGWRAWSADWHCRFTVPTHIPRRLVASGDRLYATLGFNAPLSELDAATGEVLRTFKGTAFTDEILCHDGLLILAINEGPQEPGRRGKPGDPPVRKAVAALDAKSGEMLWRTGDYGGLRSKTGSMDRISHLSMAAGGGQVFFVDGDALVSLDLKSGRQVWRAPRPKVPEHPMRYHIRITDMCSLVYH
ncbi:MAG: methyltransferase domain-containing protein, partial [Planctomycetota bacterium]